MKRKNLLSYLGVVFLFFMGMNSGYSASVDIDVTQVMSQKMQMERALEQHVNKVLEKVLGPGKATVVISIEPEVEKSRQEIETWAEQKREEEGAGAGAPVSRRPKEYLPGIPLKKNLVEDVTAREKAPPAARQTGVKKSIESIVKLPPSFIKRMRVIITIDERVKEDMVSTIESLVSEILDLNPARGDRLIVKKIRYAGNLLSKIFLNPYFYLVSLFLALVAFFIFFVFGPIKKFLFGLLDTLREVAATKREAEAVASVGGGPGGGERGEGFTEEQLEAVMEEREKKKAEEGVMDLLFGEGTERKELSPFKFLKGADLKKLLFLMKKEPPKTIALVLGFLEPAQAAQLLSSLSEEERVQVALEATKLRQISKESLIRMVEAIREKVDFVAGGLDNLSEIFGMMAEKSRSSLLASLEEKNPALAEKLKGLIFTFDQIAELEDQTLRFVLEEVDTESLAVALRNASDKLKKRLMSNMSEGAAALLKETMEFGKPATLAQIQAEQTKIIETIRRLEREGKISLGEGRTYALDEEELSEQELTSLMEGIQGGENAPEVDNGKASDFYNRGVKAYEAGRYEEAVEFFKKSIAFNPGIWQAHQYLGSSYYAMGNEAEGLTCYKKALELNPENEDLRAWVEEQAK